MDVVTSAEDGWWKFFSTSALSFDFRKDSPATVDISFASMEDFILELPTKLTLLTKDVSFTKTFKGKILRIFRSTEN